MNTDELLDASNPDSVDINRPALLVVHNVFWKSPTQLRHSSLPFYLHPAYLLPPTSAVCCQFSHPVNIIYVHVTVVFLPVMSFWCCQQPVTLLKMRNLISHKSYVVILLFKVLLLLSSQWVGSNVKLLLLGWTEIFHVSRCGKLSAILIPLFQNLYQRWSPLWLKTNFKMFWP